MQSMEQANEELKAGQCRIGSQTMLSLEPDNAMLGAGQSRARSRTVQS